MRSAGSRAGRSTKAFWRRSSRRGFTRRAPATTSFPASWSVRIRRSTRSSGRSAATCSSRRRPEEDVARDLGGAAEHSGRPHDSERLLRRADRPPRFLRGRGSTPTTTRRWSPKTSGLPRTSSASAPATSAQRRGVRHTIRPRAPRKMGRPRRACRGVQRGARLPRRAGAEGEAAPGRTHCARVKKQGLHPFGMQTSACRKRSPFGGLFLVLREKMRYNGVG